jgi:peptidoglycan/LPS O-acetylase OafA/YrhL
MGGRVVYGSSLEIQNRMFPTGSLMKNHRFAFLDALRGVAAFAVMLHHVGGEFNVLSLVPHGYLAVDFFFALSGFVLAYAYEQRLNDGMPFSGFTKIRALRLYPMALLGHLLAVFVYLLTHLHHIESHFVLVALIGILMIASPINLGVQYPNMFPINPPFWTLFCEFYVNLFYARFAVLRTKCGLISCIAAFAVMLVALALHKNSVNVAGLPSSLAYYFVRTGFSFFAGVSLFRLWKSRSFYHVSGFIIAAALALSFAIPDLRPYGHSISAIVDLLMIFGLIPFVVLAGASISVPEKFKSLAGLSGRLSYPFYAIHFPMIFLTKALAAKWGLHGFELCAFVSISMIGTIILAWISVRIWDEPVRRLLGRSS